MPARVDVSTSVYVGLPQSPGTTARDAALERATEAARTTRPTESRTRVAALNTHRPYSRHSIDQLEMWADAQRDGRPAEHTRRPLFNAAKFG